MLCVIDVDTLLDNLAFVDSGLRNSTTVITLHTAADHLHISGHDSETSISTTARCRNSSDGTVTVHTGPLLKLLNRLTGIVELACDNDNNLTVSNNNRSYTFLRTDTTPHTTITYSNDNDNECDIDSLAAAVAAVRNAADTKLPVVSLNVTGQQATVAATDTYRLAGITFPLTLPDLALLAPIPALLLGGKRTFRTFGTDKRGRIIKLGGDNSDVTFRTSVTSYPNVAPVLAARPPLRCTTHIATLRAALGNIAAVADDQAVAFQLDNTTGTLTLTVTSRYGTGTEQLSVKDSTEPYTFHAVARYIDDALATHAACGADHVEMRGAGPNDAVTFTSTTQVTCSTVVMPVRAGNR
jgi:DNA polymerase III sliding clamp (beta) subunit (PCNA family)